MSDFQIFELGDIVLQSKMTLRNAKLAYSRHNFVFLEGVKARSWPTPLLKAVGTRNRPRKVFALSAVSKAGWGFSQTFYRVKADIEKMGYAPLEDFLVGFWEGLFLTRDANNLLAMLWTWQNGDISANEIYNGDLPKALSSIKAKAIVMPASTDLYFPRHRSPAHAQC
jgi:homoserine O-acetyltransferase/O-succinyltransferase